MGEYSQCGINFSTVSSLSNFIVNDFPNKTGVYVCAIRSKEQEQAFLKFIDQIKESCSIVFEEASKFCNPKFIPNEINNAIHYGRHYAMNLVFTARRAQELNRAVTSQSTAIISFQQTEPNDITILKKVFSEASKLPDLKYIPTDPEENEYLILGNTTLLTE